MQGEKIKIVAFPLIKTRLSNDHPILARKTEQQEQLLPAIIRGKTVS